MLKLSLTGILFITKRYYIEYLFLGTVIVLALSFLAPYFYFIPKAALAAVLITAVSSLFDYKIFPVLWRCNSKFLKINYYTIYKFDKNSQMKIRKIITQLWRDIGNWKKKSASVWKSLKNNMSQYRSNKFFKFFIQFVLTLGIQK